MKRLSFINQFKIEFILLCTGCRKVLAKMPGDGFIAKNLEIQWVNIVKQFVRCYVAIVFTALVCSDGGAESNAKTSR